MKFTLMCLPIMFSLSLAVVNAQVDDLEELRDPDAKFGRVIVDESQSLADSVAQLNEISQYHNLGKTQEPLTPDEVIGAIRRWSRALEINAETRAKFDRIAETGMLHAGDELNFSTGLWSDGNYYSVWWLDLTVDNYTFRVRDRTISSRLQTDEEIAMLDRRRAEARELFRNSDRTPY